MEHGDAWSPIGPAVVFHAPPHWPPPPQGWLPPPGWAPPKDWGPAPDDWDFFLELPSGATERSGVPGLRTVAPRYADPGYLTAEKRQRALTKWEIVRSRFNRIKLAAWSTRQRRYFTAVVTIFILLLTASVVFSPTREVNSRYIATRLCPPVIVAEIADRLEVAEEKVSGRKPQAGDYSPVAPPRGSMRQLSGQIRITNSIVGNETVTAEGNYLTAEKEYWQFHCTVDVGLSEPEVTRVSVNPMQGEGQEAGSNSAFSVSLYAYSMTR